MPKHAESKDGILHLSHCSGLNTNPILSGYWNNNNWFFFLFQFSSTIKENCTKLFQKHKAKVTPFFKFPLVKFLICFRYQGVDCFKESGTCLPFLQRLIWAFLHFCFCSVNWASFQITVFILQASSKRNNTILWPLIHSVGIPTTPQFLSLLPE